MTVCIFVNLHTLNFYLVFAQKFIFFYSSSAVFELNIFLSLLTEQHHASNLKNRKFCVEKVQLIFIISTFLCMPEALKLFSSRLKLINFWEMSLWATFALIRMLHCCFCYSNKTLVDKQFLLWVEEEKLLSIFWFTWKATRLPPQSDAT